MMDVPAPALRAHSPLPAFAAWAGPRHPKIVFVGEAWGAHEQEIHLPFIGATGQELWRMLGEAWPDQSPEEHRRVAATMLYGHSWAWERARWMEEAGIAYTNVLAFRPIDNKMRNVCANKKEVGGDLYRLPSLSIGAYLRPEYLGELERLAEELATAKPNLVVALGGTATWALLQATNIGTIRGAITSGVGDFAPFKVLPTYHPSAVVQNWSLRPIVIADLIKAGREAAYPDIRRPQRRVMINPTLAEVECFVSQTINMAPPRLGCDIETANRMITCISFARSPTEAICIPFSQSPTGAGNYWNTAAEECAVWDQVERLLTSGAAIVGQNFSYDLQYLLAVPLRINPRGLEDTMLKHHSIFPEMLKGLGFLGSVYTNEAAWKLMRQDKPDTEKLDE